MAGKKKDEEELKEEENEAKIKRILIIIASLSVVIIAASYFLTRPAVETYVVSGVTVNSEISQSDLQKRTYISLYNTTKSKAELTCKFELSAISVGDIRGYRIKIEHGENSIYLGKQSATISGLSEQDLLKSCHVFACMRDNITCPSDFTAFRQMVDNADSVGIVLDSSAGSDAGRGYAELVGILSYVQAQRVDRNFDGTLDQEEINNNTFFIYPFLKENDTCLMQPFHNLVETINKTNETYSCNLEDAIYILKSDENKISINGSKIILSGDDTSLHTESIILRDSLAPEWILTVYNLQ